jgi:Arc/MetJ-type ribon-helix-helix transcriptional regulator
MSIQVPADVEAQVKKLVDDGTFVDSDQAIREAVRLLAYSIKGQSLREKVQRAQGQADRGEAVAWSDGLGETVWNETRERHKRGETPGADVLP